MVDVRKQTTFYAENYPANFEKIAKDIIEQNPDLPLKEVVSQAAQPAKEATQNQSAFITDPIFYRNAEFLLAFIVALVVLGSLILIYVDKTPTDGLIAIGSGAVGALIGSFSTQK
ncbi:hypothetical protein [Methanosarcina mazei]|uniref:hypothetical protein n=1 Tax=Methanosarcina mazei TaxID=2209 RepID=UPI00064F06CC|nr:hypothetical protein [Methanosarcina mazei]